MPGRRYAVLKPTQSSGSRMGEKERVRLRNNNRSRPLTKVGTEMPKVDVPKQR
jgi:hypothetical protein